MFQVRQLQYRYPKNPSDTLRGMDFQVEDGEVFGLLGPSGVGKSTTQKILTKLLSGYQGSVRYRDQDLQQYGREFYEEIGVGFEMPVHFSKLTAMENLQFFARLYRHHTDPVELLERLGFLAVYHSRDFTSLLMKIMAYMLIFLLPVLLSQWNLLTLPFLTGLLYVLPTQASYSAVYHAVNGSFNGSYMYGVLYLIGVGTLLFWLVQRGFGSFAEKESGV